MKKVLMLVAIVFASFTTSGVNAGFSFDALFGGDNWSLGISSGGSGQVPYCRGSQCSVKGGINSVGKNLDDNVKKGGKLSEFAQTVVSNLLSFISIIAVLYIIYSGFRIMTSAGDEETVKSQKSTILYVVIGIIVMWLAYSIVSWLLGKILS